MNPIISFIGLLTLYTLYSTPTQTTSLQSTSQKSLPPATTSTPTAPPAPPVLPLPTLQPPLPGLPSLVSHAASYAPPILQPPSSNSLPDTDTVTPNTPTQNNLSTTGMAKLLTDPTIPLSSKIIALQSSHTSLSGKAQKITPQNKYRSPQALTAATQAGQFSFTQQQRTAHTTGQIFSDGTLATAYQTFIDAVEADPHFLPLFRRIHILALHEIYMYLMGISVTLNMTYFTDTKTAMIIEKIYGLNKKTLIVARLLNLIQAQLTQALKALFPGLPESYAIASGIKALEHDHISNPLSLMLNLEKSILAILGMESLSQSQVTSLVNALTNPKNQSLLQTNNISQQDLTAALSIINQYGIQFIIPLLKNEQAKEALQSALDILVSTYNHNEITKNYQAVLANITQNTTTQLSEQQMNLFMGTISKCAYGIPLAQALNEAQSFYALLKNNSNQVLSTAQKNNLRSVIAYILQNYEQQTASMLSAIIAKLGKLQPSYQTLSPSQSVLLQKIATSMLDKNKPLALDALNQTNRELLAYALSIFAYTNTKMNTQKMTLMGLSKQLQESPLSWAELTNAQSNALRQVLTLCAAYVFKPLHAQDAGNTFSQEQQNTLVSLCNQIQSAAFKGFTSFSPADQILLLQMYQNVATVVETRLEEHKLIGSPIAGLFQANTALQQALFQSLSTDQYLTLNTLDQQIQSSSTFSFSQISKEVSDNDNDDSNNNATATKETTDTSPQQIPSLSPYQSLMQLFSPSTTLPYSYASLLQKLQEQQIANPVLQTFISSLSTTDQEIYQQIIAQAQQENFSLSQLSSQQKSACASLFSTLIKGQATQKPSTPSSLNLLSSTQESNVQTIAYVLNNTSSAAQNKAGFLSILKKYLEFFTLYTASLEQYDPTNYTGLSLFQKNAQAVEQQLANTPIETLNPPLFFYEKNTLKTIQLLPFLAQSIETTKTVPYPTFPMSLALNTNAVDPLDGKTYSNQETLGSNISGFTYNKFFFYNIADTTQTAQNSTSNSSATINNSSNSSSLTPSSGTQDPHTPQPPTELTGDAAQAIPWIIKKEVATTQLAAVDTTSTNTIKQSSAPTTTIYLPGAIPNNTSGFYMNIPTFKQNPTNPQQALVRLYEQPLYAQPAWLNNPGHTTMSPNNKATTITPGVITVLRGCLGDFQSLLDLNIFDPCLTMVFQSALGLPLTTQAQCSIYLTAKQAEITAMQDTHTINTSRVQSALSSGAIGIPDSSNTSGGTT